MKGAGLFGTPKGRCWDLIIFRLFEKIHSFMSPFVVFLKGSFLGAFQVRMTWQKNGIGPWARRVQQVPTWGGLVGFLCVCSDVAWFGWEKARVFPEKHPLEKWKHVATVRSSSGMRWFLGLSILLWEVIDPKNPPQSNRYALEVLI